MVIGEGKSTESIILTALNTDAEGKAVFWKALKLFDPGMFYQASLQDPYKLAGDVIGYVMKERPDLMRLTLETVTNATAVYMDLALEGERKREEVIRQSQGRSPEVL